MEAFRMIWKGLKTWWEVWLGLWMFGLVWVLCWATIVLGPPATFGFFQAARSLMTENEIKWGEYLRAARENFLASWLWFLANLLVLFVVFANTTYYGALESGLAGVLQVLAIAVGFIWVAVQFYALPYYVLLEKKSLLVAWKNGLLTLLASPIFSLTLWLALAPLIALHIFIMPVFLAGPGLVVLLSSMAVEDRIQKFRIRERETEQSG
jgi:uncharacterized membrane protein YesL